jgi:FkbM family methyltransferase
MQDRKKLLSSLDQVERLANGGRLSRLLHHPLRYLTAVGFDRLVYGRTKKPLLKTARTFYGLNFTVALPAGTDIYLSGGKTHVSELRLSRFMLRYLPDGADYVDVGGHYGFFAGLAHAILNKRGKITVFEPAPDTFEFLKKNLAATSAELRQRGLADREETLNFYQFPARYSEYNSLDVEQYAGEDWIKNFPPRKVAVPVATLAGELKKAPDWLKIDVEGLEDRVVAGGAAILRDANTLITMEYLPEDLSNGSHRKAFDQLVSWGYQSYRINDAGDLLPAPDPESFLSAANQDSTNLVFSKNPPKAIV